MSVSPELERLQFPEHYAYVLVDVGEKKEVFYLPINGGYVGFIERIACDWFEGTNPPSTCSVVEMIVDGFPRKFDYEIQINKPYVFDPPIVARKFIRWFVTNKDTKSHYYGIQTDGYLCRLKSSS
jgi:hypothetical protein